MELAVAREVRQKIQTDALSRRQVDVPTDRLDDLGLRARVGCLRRSGHRACPAVVPQMSRHQPDEQPQPGLLERRCGHRRIVGKRRQRDAKLFLRENLRAFLHAGRPAPVDAAPTDEHALPQLPDPEMLQSVRVLRIVVVVGDPRVDHEERPRRTGIEPPAQTEEAVPRHAQQNLPVRVSMGMATRPLAPFRRRPGMGGLRRIGGGKDRIPMLRTEQDIRPRGWATARSHGNFGHLFARIISLPASSSRVEIPPCKPSWAGGVPQGIS